MRQKQFLPIIWAMAGLVGIYQLPLIDNTLMKHDVSLDLNSKFSYPLNFQQSLEDGKISMVSYLDRKDKPVIIKISSPASTINSQSFSDSNALVTTNPPTSDTSVNISSPKVCRDNCTVLMMGDSVMGDVDYSLERLMKKNHPNWEIIDAHKVSSGLTNKNYYDWPKTAKQLLEKYHPDYTVILMGTNDAQGMLINGRAFNIGKTEWNQEYANRINNIMSSVETNSGPWIWVELPVVRDSGFNQRLQQVRNVQATTVKEHLLETQSIFGNVNHTQPFNMQLRAGDGIHLSVSGANLVANHIYNHIESLNH